MNTDTKYAIAVLRNMYLPDIAGDRAVEFIGDDPARPEDYILYDTIEAAQCAVDVLDTERYVLAHGEAGRPDHIIVTGTTAEYISTGRWGDKTNYDWEGHECDHMDDDGNACGVCEDCIDMMINQDIDYVRSRAVAA
jgi:hypothetical protein